MFRSLSAIAILFLLIAVNLPPDASGLAAKSEGNWTGSPAPGYILYQENPIEGLTPFYLDNEKIIFTVKTENKASVDLEFTVRNSANVSSVAYMYIYYEVRLPADIECYGNGTELKVRMLNLTPPSFPPRAASFGCEVGPYESMLFHVTYNISIQSVIKTERTGPFGAIKNTEQTFRYLYVGSLGRYWNGTVTDAIVEFRIAKELFSSGCEGWDLQEQDGYTVASRHFSNWSSEDLTFQWSRMVKEGNTMVILGIALPCALFPLAAILLLRRAKRNRNVREKVKSSEGPSVQRSF